MLCPDHLIPEMPAAGQSAAERLCPSILSFMTGSYVSSLNVQVKPFPLISFTLVMVMKACGSISSTVLFTVPQYLVEEYHKLGVNLYPGYGLTESANLVSGNPEPLSKPGSVGLIFPEMEYKTVDGELWLKGKNMMDGYVGKQEPNSYEDGWFRTGDLVRMDDDGFLYITGRIKEVIVLPNGENISPAELEAQFNATPYIQDSQVFEDVDENGRHFLAVEVVPRATETAKLGDIDVPAFIKETLQKINAALPPFQRVSKITVRTSDFERTPSMKIVRYKKCQ